MTEITNDTDARRHLRTGERDGRPARTLVLERHYPTTAADLWDALTDPDRIPRWLAPVEGDLRLGGRYQLEGNAGGEITACDRPRHLALTWEFDGAVSWVEVHLAEDADGARLRLEHESLVDDSGLWEQFGPGAVGIGWDLSLLGLAEHLRTGEAVDVDAEVTRGGPAAGLVVRSSEAWCAADIAAGTPADAARAAAARTLAMYTGQEPDRDEAPAD